MDYPSPYYVEVEDIVLPIRVDGGNFIVNTGIALPTLADIDRIGLYQQLVTVDITLNPMWNLDHIKSSLILPSTALADQSYTVYDPELTLTFDAFTLDTDCDDIVFIYTVLVNGLTSIPSFIEYDSSLRTIWI